MITISTYEKFQNIEENWFGSPVSSTVKDTVKIQLETRKISYGTLKVRHCMPDPEEFPNQVPTETYMGTTVVIRIFLRRRQRANEVF